MRSVSFDYPNTCPKIDRAISSAQEIIDSFLADVLDEASPLLPPKERDRLATQYAESLYSKLEDIFENTRSANEEMRREAESQIENLKDQLSDLESELRIAQEAA